jgi:hypothetical protein
MTKIFTHTLLKAIIKLDHIEKRVRRSLFDVLRSMPGILHFKMVEKLKCLKELSDIVNSLDAQCYIVGGWAYDAKRGRLTKYHNDFDIALLESDMASIFSVLEREGFIIHQITPFLYIGEKNGMKVDLFIWKEVVEGFIECMEHGNLVRIPRSFFSDFEDVELYGIKFKTLSNEFLASLAPLTRSLKTRQYLASLSTKHPLQFNKRPDEITIQAKVLVHELDVPKDLQIYVIKTQGSHNASPVVHTG